MLLDYTRLGPTRLIHIQRLLPWIVTVSQTGRSDRCFPSTLLSTRLQEASLARMTWKSATLVKRTAPVFCLGDIGTYSPARMGLTSRTTKSSCHLHPSSQDRELGQGYRQQLPSYSRSSNFTAFCIKESAPSTSPHIDTIEEWPNRLKCLGIVLDLPHSTGRLIPT